MEIRVEGNKQSPRLVCSGNATVEAAAEIREALIEALQKSKRVSLDVKGIEKVDVSFLQLLIAAEKTAQQQNTRIEIDREGDCPALLSAAEKAGFCREQEHTGDAEQHSILASYRAAMREEEGDV